MDETQHASGRDPIGSGDDGAGSTPARATASGELRPFEEQARLSCQAAAQRYQAIADAHAALIAARDATAEYERRLEEARLHVDAAKLAWYHTVVYYERVKARRRGISDD